MTPFSPTSLARGIDGLLVGVARVGRAAQAEGLSPEKERLADQDQRSPPKRSRSAQEADRRRRTSEAPAKRASDLLVNRIDRWRRARKAGGGDEQDPRLRTHREDDKYLPLIISPENAKATVGGSSEAPFVIANSMREVQPEINVLVSPSPSGCSRGRPMVLPNGHCPPEDDD